MLAVDVIVVLRRVLSVGRCLLCGMCWLLLLRVTVLWLFCVVDVVCWWLFLMVNVVLWLLVSVVC